MQSPGRILILDDEQRWRDAQCSILQSGGFQADATGTVSQAWELLNENVYHLVILDLSLLSGDGHNADGMLFLSELHERGYLSTVKVIILSAYCTMEYMRKAYRYGVEDVLSKDEFFGDSSEFVERVRQILAGR